MMRRSSQRKSEEVKVAEVPVEPAPANGVVEGAMEVDPPSGSGGSSVVESPSPPSSPPPLPSMPESFEFITMNCYGDLRYMKLKHRSKGGDVIDAAKVYDSVVRKAYKRNCTIEEALQIVANNYVINGFANTVDEVKTLFHTEDNINHGGDYSWRAAEQTVKTFLCPICQLFDCPLHPHMLGKFEFRAPPRNEEDDLEPCNENCFKNRRSGPKIPALDEIPQGTVDNLLRNMHRFGQLYCLYSVKGLGCAKVKAIMTTYFSDEIEKQAAKAAVTRETVSEATLFNRIKRKMIRKQDMPSQWYPCECTKDCGPKCECNQAHNFCEDICHCPLSCPNRFPGCKCEEGMCDGDDCPCYFAGRECDRNLCRECGAAETTGPPEQRKGACWNFQISRHDYKPIVICKSDIAGNGCFITIDVMPGDLVSEYVGELIPHDEAELRGEEYDKMGISYLFKLNNDFSIDAYYKGNTIRFANHSKHPNMYVRVARVNGFDRVGLYASRALVKGEELFFDYLYDDPQTEQYVPIDWVPPPLLPEPVAAPAVEGPAVEEPAVDGTAVEGPAVEGPAVESTTPVD